MSYTEVSKFSSQWPSWSLDGGIFAINNVTLDLIPVGKSTNGNCMNHFDPLVVLKDIFSEFYYPDNILREHKYKDNALFFLVTNIIF